MKPNKHPELVVLGLDGAIGSYIRKRIEEGSLPNFARAFAEGTYFPECRSSYPTITPTCWASFATGTTPDRHGAVDEVWHPEGTPIGELRWCYHSGLIKAERFWEAASRAGKKSLVIDLPTAEPAKDDGTLYACQGIQLDESMDSNSIGGFQIPFQFFTYNPRKTETDNRVFTPSGQWQPSNPKFTVMAKKTNNSLFLLENHWNQTGENRLGIEPVSWYAELKPNGLILYLSEKDRNTDKGFFVPSGGWSEVFTRKLNSKNGSNEYAFRVKLLYLDAENESFMLFLTPGADMRRLSLPRDFAESINFNDIIPGPNTEGEFMGLHSDPDTSMEIQEMNFAWQKRVISKAMEERQPDIVISYIGYLDSVNHCWWSILTGVDDRERSFKERAAEWYRRSYDLADSYLGWLYENVIGPDTTLVILSDHGAVGFNRVIRPHDVLEKAGLLVYRIGPDGKREIDPSKTVAWPFRSAYAYVNLKGRDPEGIVEPEDYVKTVHKIIAALQEGFRDQETGLCTLAFAVPRDQAGFIGLDAGSAVGDVVYGIIGSHVGGQIGGVHACQIPAAKTAAGGNINALCVIRGPGFKKGTVLTRPINLYDIMPTVCYSLDLPQPADATGAVVFQALQTP
jgi:predicted AlkP superfamily phosphohydrolase/phosphomutase